VGHDETPSDASGETLKPHAAGRPVRAGLLGLAHLETPPAMCIGKEGSDDDETG
jgi:hypothetical protein